MADGGQGVRVSREEYRLVRTVIGLRAALRDERAAAFNSPDYWDKRKATDRLVDALHEKAVRIRGGEE